MEGADGGSRARNGSSRATGAGGASFNTGCDELAAPGPPCRKAAASWWGLAFALGAALILTLASVAGAAPRTLVRASPAVGSGGLSGLNWAAAAGVAAPSSVNPSATAPTGAPAPMPVVSRGKPAFASTQPYPAANADDASYSTYWTPNGLPAWLAYDLSSVPAGQRSRVDVAWYNDPITSPYDHKLIADHPYNLPANYTIDVNASPGGGVAPSTGWVTLATVTGNTYHSRQHVIDMTGYNWVRINVTASLGGMPMFNMDVHDASAGAGDSWLMLGDSITQDGLPHEPVSFGGGSNVSQLVTPLDAGRPIDRERDRRGRL